MVILEVIQHGLNGQYNDAYIIRNQLKTNNNHWDKSG